MDDDAHLGIDVIMLALSWVHICMRMRKRHVEMREMLMRMCRQGTANDIRLGGEHSVNNQMLSIWSRYFEKKYIRNHIDVDVYFTSLEGKKNLGSQRISVEHSLAC